MLGYFKMTCEWFGDIAVIVALVFSGSTFMVDSKRWTLDNTYQNSHLTVDDNVKEGVTA